MVSVPHRFAPYADLFRDLSRLLRQRRAGDLRTPFAHALGAALDAYADNGWRTLNSGRRSDLERLPDRDRQIAFATVDRTLASLAALWPTGPHAETARQHFSERIARAAVLAGERLVALRMADEPDARIDHLTTLMTELVQGAHLVGATDEVARAHGVSRADIAPAVFAAIVANGETHLNLTPAAAVERFHLDEGARLPRPELTAVAARMADLLRQAEARIARTIASYAIASREAFYPTSPITPPEPPRNVGRLASLVTPPPAPAKPQINVGTLIAFGSSARGGTETARVEGALELFQSIISVLQRRHRGPHPITRHALLARGLSALRSLAEIVRTERAVHGDADKKWREIDTEMKFLRQKAEAEARGRRRDEGGETSPAAIKIVYHFPEEFSALECRALYLHQAVAHGVPLGCVLKELYDSAVLTFGPTERRFFERLAFYGARKYAANFAAHADPRVDQVSHHDVRVEQVRGILQRIEIELRSTPQASDAELLTRGHALIQEAVARGDLRRDEAALLVEGHADSHGQTVPSVVESMITRIRAGQEVRFLTALLAAEGHIPDDIIASYHDLPHTRRYALLDAPETRLAALVARNGQSMLDLERHTRARWMRYRQQAPAGRDVKAIAVGRTEDDIELDNPLRLKGRARPFRKPLPPVNPRARQGDDEDAPSLRRAGRPRG